MMGNQWKFAIGLICCLVYAHVANSQLSVVVKSVPVNTPAEEDIYIVGSFNDWNTADSIYKLNKKGDGSYFIRLPFRGDFKYKFTRGSWKKVEGSFNGEAIDNREFKMDQSTSDTIYVSIVSWEDKSTNIPNVFDTLRLVVEEIPDNTPKDASVYVVGNFNDWHPGSPKYRLKALPNGGYSIKIPLWLDPVEYKFTRGDWGSAEGRRNGRAIRNRTYIYDKNNTEIRTSIKTWEDLAGGFTFYTYILMFSALQGFLLIIAINRLQNNNRAANYLLSVIIVLISFALLGRVSTYPREVFQAFPKLILVPDLAVYFLYGPLFLFYIQKLLTIQPRSARRRWVHFIFAGFHLLAYLPLLFMSKDTFISQVNDLKPHLEFTFNGGWSILWEEILAQQLRLTFTLSGGIALLFNIYYLIRCISLLRIYRRNANAENSFEDNVQYLNTVLSIKGLVLGVWAFMFLASVAGRMSNWNTTDIVEISTDVIWLVFSSVTYCLGYFAMNQPELFKLPEESLEEEVPEVIEPTGPSENILPQKNKLAKIMEEEKPFLNPKLNLAELADMMDTTPHNLSKVINEGFGKNFFDFVNTYRVEEFKLMIQQNAHKNQTLLAIALEVGFNSKTAFNRSFKKLTDTTPGKYLKDLQEGTEVEKKES